MYKQFLIILTSAFLLISCEFYKKKTIDDKALIDVNISYNSVDVFPLFPGCENSDDESFDQCCSKIKITESIYTSLSKNDFVTSESISGKIDITILISKEGDSTLESIVTTEQILSQITDLEIHIAKAVDDLPVLQPAIKRGILVSSKITIPIKIKTN